MPVVSVRVPERLKEEMRLVRINWSEYLRRKIEERIELERRSRAAELVDAIRSKTRPGAFEAARSVREDRDS